MQDANDIFGSIRTRKRGVAPDVLEQTVVLAVEVAREGRGGRKVGTLFDDGELISEITPELWMWNRYRSHPADRPTSTRARDEVTVVSVEE